MKKVLRYASLLFAAAMLAVSCGDPADPQTPVTPEKPENPENPEKPEQPQEPVTGTLTLSVDKLIIQSNGSDAATFTVKLDDKDITSEIVFRDSKSGDAVIKTDGMKFTTTEAKEYAIWAEYKTLMSNEVKVTAVASEVPETPEDPQPANTSFVRRVLLTQFTGTECGWCPVMKAGLKDALSDESIADKVIKADAHNFSAQDPAYIGGFYTPADGWPTVILDWTLSFGHQRTTANTSKVAKQLINERYDAEEAYAGIAVNSKYADGVITLKAVVKAAQTGNYRVGAWLLEDGLKGQQKDNSGLLEDWMHNLDDCVRIADSKASSSNFCGHSLGQIKAGETAERMFIMNMKKSWVPENCELVVFVSRETDKSYSVTNVVKCPIDGVLQFEYK